MTVTMSPCRARDALPDDNKVVSRQSLDKDNLIIYPFNLNFVIPYVPPISLNLELISPTPPGEVLLPPASVLDLDYTFKPWEVPFVKPIPGIPDIFGRIEFLLPFDLLIITHEDFMDELVPLKVHNDYTDLSTRIYSWQDLAERFHDQGMDDPERIKKAIASFRQGCGIRYVMLVGDSDRLPGRYCMVYDPTHWGDGYVPSDLYYADLFAADGTSFDDWDGNGNGIFGEMQGGTWTTGSALEDINRILANGTQGAIHVAVNQEVSISVQLDPGVLMENPCDWWMVASTPFGIFSFVLPPSWQMGIMPVLKEVPVSIPDPVEVLRLGLPEGSYAFYFGLDDQANGVLDGNIWYDWVTVEVK